MGSHLLAVSFLSRSGGAGDLAITSALAVLFGYLGWRNSRRFRALAGVTPWRLPSVVWALICFFFLIFGVLLEMYAQLTTRAVGHPGGRAGGPLGLGATPFSHLPERGGEAGRAGVPVPAAVQIAPEVEPEPALPPPPSGADGQPAGFGWYRDVTRRHESRWYDGRGWTDVVRDGSQMAKDPLRTPPRPRPSPA